MEKPSNISSYRTSTLPPTPIAIDLAADPLDSAKTAEPPQALDPAVANVPKTIGRYRLIEELGRGGMGVVYKAEDPQLDRPVAIKIILFPPRTTEQLRAQLEKRFEREARSAAGIHHPAVVTVHDFGRDGDYLYLVMELVTGESLADRLATGWRPARAEALEIVARVADGLAAAHAAGVVHRDVTPRNILIEHGPSRRVVVTDFGIARSVGEETFELTHTGVLVGSPSFMAPEQVRSKEFDERADIFSLGVVLYQLLTGELPFRARDLTSLLYQIVHEDPFARKEIRAGLDPAAVGFLERCLAKDPADRIPTATRFGRDARALKALQNHAETGKLEATVALGAATPGSDAGGRNRRAGRVLAGAAMVTIAAAVWALTSFSSDGVRRTEPSSTIARAEAQTSEVPATHTILAETATLKVANTVVVETPEPDSEVQPQTPLRAPARADDTAVANPATTETRPLTPASSSAPPVSTAARTADAPPAPKPSEPEPQAASKETDIEPTKPEPATPDLLPAAPQPAVDTVSPMLIIDDMPKELTATEVVLSGRAMDDHGDVELTVDDRPVPIGAEGEFITRQPLAPGRNTLAFVAVDAAGNRTVRSVQISAALAEVPAADEASPSTEPATGVVPAVAPMRFVDRGDGTMVDRVTGIFWTKRVEPVAGWKASKSYCKKLEMGRFRDWMLPNIEELEELYLSSMGVMSFPGGSFWSSSKNGSSNAWAFEFTRGQSHSQLIAGPEEAELNVFCLRRQRPRTARHVQDPFASGDNRWLGAGSGLPPRDGLGDASVAGGDEFQNATGQSSTGGGSGGGKRGGKKKGGGKHGGG